MRDSYPCEFGPCPHGATVINTCREMCGLGIDESNLHTERPDDESLRDPCNQGPTLYCPGCPYSYERGGVTLDKCGRPPGATGGYCQEEER